MDERKKTTKEIREEKKHLKNMQFLDGVKYNARQNILKVDWSDDEGLIIIEDNKPPTITHLEEYLTNDDWQYPHIVDILKTFPEFKRIVKITRKALKKDRYDLFKEEMNKTFPKISDIWINDIYPCVGDGKFKGIKLLYQLRDDNNILIDKEELDFNNRKYKAILTNFLLLKFFEVVDGGKITQKNFRIIKRDWDDFSNYYALPRLPDENHLSEYISRFKSIFGL